MSESRYSKRLERSTKLLKCTFCIERVLPRFYGRHLKMKHRVKTYKTCIWCLEKTWKRGTASNEDEYIHRMKCWMRRQQNETSSEATNWYCNNEAFDTWLREKPRLEGHLSLLENSFVKSLPTESVGDTEPYSSETGVYLNLIHAFPEKTFCHISVRRPAWDSFMMCYYEEFQHFVEFLPYWCLCKGGGIEHRHMIISFSDTRRFEKQWKSVRSDTRNQNGKKQIRIKDVNHLINTIIYVSNRMTEGGDFECDSGKHYMLNKSLLPESYMLFAFSFENGLLDYLTRKCKTLYPDFKNEAIRDEQGRWNVSVEFLNQLKGFVLPLKKEYEMCDEPTDLCLYLMPNVKKYIRPNTTLLGKNRREWNQHQMDNGNMLLDIIANEWVKVGVGQQKTFDLLEEMHVQKDAIIQRKDMELAEERREKDVIKTELAEERCVKALIEQQLTQERREKDLLVEERVKMELVIQQKDEQLQKMITFCLEKFGTLPMS